MSPPYVRLLRTGVAARLRRATAAGFFIAATAIIKITAAQAQESVGFSLSQQLQTTTRPSLQPEVINVGPFRGRVGVGVGITADDNANLTSSNTQSELRFNQSLDLDLHYVLTYLNEIRLQLGATLSEVVGGGSGVQRLQFELSPGSNVEFKIFAGDFLIRLYDYLAVVEDPTQDPSVANQSQLNRITNNAGLAVDWALNQLTLSAHFDYTYSTDQSSGSGLDQTTASTDVDRHTFRPGLAAAWALSPDMRTGLSFEYSKSTSSGNENLETFNGVPAQNDVDAFTIGPFLRGHLTRAITIDAAAGVYVIDAQGVGPVDYYLALSINHQVNRYLQYTAAFSRDLDFSSGTDLTQNNNFTLKATFKLGTHLSLQAGGFVNFGKVLTAQFANNLIPTQVPGDFVQYGADVGLGWTFSRKLTASIGYQFVIRDAENNSVTENRAGNFSGSYKQNRVDLSLHYAF